MASPDSTILLQAQAHLTADQTAPPVLAVTSEPRLTFSLPMSDGRRHANRDRKRGRRHKAMRKQRLNGAWTTFRLLTKQHRNDGPEALTLHRHAGRHGPPPATRERAWAAQVRLCGRFRRLAARKNFQERRGRRCRPGAGRVPLGGDDRLMALAVNQPRFLVGRK